MWAAWEGGKEVYTEQTTDINSQLVVAQVVVDISLKKYEEY